METELYHHGIKGQKWGVRRYQNPDGSLTLAGKKRALKMQNQYTEFSNDKKYRDKNGNLTYAGRKKALKMQEQYTNLTGKKIRKFPESKGKSSNGEKNEPKPKSISEMSNKEIQDKIDRIVLENRLKDLTPKQVSSGQRFVDGIKDAAISIAKDKGTRIVGDYIDKQLRNKLGLNTKNTSKTLQEKAQEYENRQKIDRGQRYFKEGKYAETSSKNDSSTNKRETWSGTVEGEGSSSKQRNNTSWNKTSTVDVEWRNVNDSNINKGRSSVRYFLEDKKKKR